MHQHTRSKFDTVRSPKFSPPRTLEPSELDDTTATHQTAEESSTPDEVRDDITGSDSKNVLHTEHDGNSTNLPMVVEIGTPINELEGLSPRPKSQSNVFEPDAQASSSLTRPSRVSTSSNIRLEDYPSPSIVAGSTQKHQNAFRKATEIASRDLKMGHEMLVEHHEALLKEKDFLDKQFERKVHEAQKVQRAYKECQTKRKEAEEELKRIRDENERLKNDLDDKNQALEVYQSGKLAVPIGYTQEDLDLVTNELKNQKKAVEQLLKLNSDQTSELITLRDIVERLKKEKLELETKNSDKEQELRDTSRHLEKALACGNKLSAEQQQCMMEINQGKLPTKPEHDKSSSSDGKGSEPERQSPSRTIKFENRRSLHDELDNDQNSPSPSSKPVLEMGSECTDIGTQVIPDDLGYTSFRTPEIEKTLQFSAIRVLVSDKPGSMSSDSNKITSPRHSKESKKLLVHGANDTLSDELTPNLEMQINQDNVHHNELTEAPTTVSTKSSSSTQSKSDIESTKSTVVIYGEESARESLKELQGSTQSSTLSHIVVRSSIVSLGPTDPSMRTSKNKSTAIAKPSTIEESLLPPRSSHNSRRASIRSSDLSLRNTGPNHKQNGASRLRSSSERNKLQTGSDPLASTSTNMNTFFASRIMAAVGTIVALLNPWWHTGKRVEPDDEHDLRDPRIKGGTDVSRPPTAEFSSKQDEAERVLPRITRLTVSDLGSDFLGIFDGNNDDDSSSQQSPSPKTKEAERRRTLRKLIGNSEDDSDDEETLKRPESHKTNTSTSTGHESQKSSTGSITERHNRPTAPMHITRNSNESILKGRSRNSANDKPRYTRPMTNVQDIIRTNQDEYTRGTFYPFICCMALAWLICLIYVERQWQINNGGYIHVNAVSTHESSLGMKAGRSTEFLMTRVIDFIWGLPAVFA